MNGIFGFSRPSIPCGPELALGLGGVAAEKAGVFEGAGPSTSIIEHGGGAAGPVADDFARFLQSILSGGQPGSDPVGQTQGIAQALNELIAGPDVTGQQSAVQQIIQQSSGRQVADLRERFTTGGGSRGTPSAVAEGLFRSEVTPRIAAATGELDLRANQQRIQALLPFLQLLGGLFFG